MGRRRRPRTTHRTNEHQKHWEKSSFHCAPPSKGNSLLNGSICGECQGQLLNNFCDEQYDKMTRHTDTLAIELHKFHIPIIDLNKQPLISLNWRSTHDVRDKK